MSERFPHNVEHRGETTPSHETHVDHETPRAHTPERTEDTHEAAERLTSIRHEAHEKARSREEVAVEPKQEKSREYSQREISGPVMVAAKRRVMKRVQKHLRPDERLFSKFTHSAPIDAVSRAAEKTVARPSGLLAGSIIAFFGSSAYLWIARHYGYEYNYLLFVLLFIGGFVIGMTIELLVHAVRRPKRSS